MKIGKSTIGTSEPAYIIAEIGMNHNGDFELARAHIEAAAGCGVDGVKFQTFKTENLLLPETDRFRAMKAYELPFETHGPLAALAAKCGVDFLSTAFGSDEAEFLNRLAVPAFKVASCDLNNLPLITDLASRKKPLLVSTGYSSIEEIDVTVELLKRVNVEFVLLHCVAAYPTAMEDSHLRNVTFFQTRYEVPVGLSDHSMSQTTVPAVARALGACVFEKHFTMDRKLKGFDHAMSADPDAMKQYVQTIRETEASLGDERSVAFGAEASRINNARRGLYWRRAMKAGDEVRLEDVAVVRPTAELVPADLEKVVGKKLVRPVSENSPVSVSEVSE